MRYLVHRGTGTIIATSDDVVIVDIDDNNLEEEDILEMAANASPSDALFLMTGEVVATVSDEDIVDMLSYNLGQVDYAYCNANPITWPLIRSRIMNTDSLFIEFNDTFTDAVYQVSSRFNEVAE